MMAVHPTAYVPPQKKKSKAERYTEKVRAHYKNDRKSEEKNPEEAYKLFGLLCAGQFHEADDYLQSYKLFKSRSDQPELCSGIPFMLEVLNGALELLYDMSIDAFQRILNTGNDNGVRFRSFGMPKPRAPRAAMEQYNHHHRSRFGNAPSPGLKNNHPIYDNILKSKDPVRAFQLLDGDYEGSGSRPWRRTKDRQGLSPEELGAFLTRVLDEYPGFDSLIVELQNRINQKRIKQRRD